MDQLWFNACGCQWCWITHWQPLFSLTTKIQFQQAVNPVSAFMVPGIALPAQQLEQLLKTVARIAFCQFSQRMDHRFITPGIGLIKIYRPAQR
jgi:hypothetical protein